MIHNRKLAKRIANSGVLTNIYGLVDPRHPGAIRYIGKANDIHNRLKGHIGEARDVKKYYSSYKNNWIRSILNAGFRPEIVLISVITTKSWKEKERHYIKLFKSFGARLVNGSEGGDGCTFLTPEERKLKTFKGEENPFYGKTHDKKMRKNLSSKNIEFFKSPEGLKRREEISKERKSREPWNKGLKLEDEKYKSGKKNKGKKRTEVVKAEMTRTRKGKSRPLHSEETKKKISASKTGVKSNITKKTKRIIK